MIEPERVGDLIWRCPVCGFTAMSKKVVEAHIQREHPSEARSNPSQDKPKVAEQPGLNENKKHKNEREHSGEEKRDKGKNGKEKAKKWKRYKIGSTHIKVLERPEIEIRDQRGWQFFLTANYVATLHKKRVRVKLVDGTEWEGILKAKDPYFVGLVLEGGKKIYINKAHILWIEPIGGD